MADNATVVDQPARTQSKDAIAGLIVTAVFSWANSPYYYAWPSSMAYGDTYTVHRDADGKIWGELKVQVANNSNTPARDVTVRFDTLDDDASVTASQHYRPQKYTGPDGNTMVIVTVPRISAKTVETFTLNYTLNETLNQIRKGRQDRGLTSGLKTSDFKDAARRQANVSDIYVELGAVKKASGFTTTVGIRSPNLYSIDIGDYSGPWE